MLRFILVLIVFLSSTSGSNVNNGDGMSEGSPSKKVVDVTVHISEAGEEYNEKIEVDPNKRTELFQVPAHPEVDVRDSLHDFKPASDSSSQDVEVLLKREKRQSCICGIFALYCCLRNRKVSGKVDQKE